MRMRARYGRTCRGFVAALRTMAARFAAWYGQVADLPVSGRGIMNGLATKVGLPSVAAAAAGGADTLGERRPARGGGDGACRWLNPHGVLIHRRFSAPLPQPPPS